MIEIGDIHRGGSWSMHIYSKLNNKYFCSSQVFYLIILSTREIDLCKQWGYTTIYRTEKVHNQWQVPNVWCISYSFCEYYVVAFSFMRFTFSFTQQLTLAPLWQAVWHLPDFGKLTHTFLASNVRQVNTNTHTYKFVFWRWYLWTNYDFFMTRKCVVQIEFGFLACSFHISRCVLPKIYCCTLSLKNI